MNDRSRSRPPFRRVALLCLLVGLFVPATAGADPTPAECDARANDTPGKLLPCIQTDDLWTHMQAFQAIADANPGPGRPSVAQLRRARLQGVGRLRRADRCRQAGYDVTIQPYKFTYFAYVGTPTLSEVSPTAHDFTLGHDWNPGTSNGHGDRATLQPAGGIVIPPTPTPSSASGCTAADFSGFIAGHGSR